MNLRLDYSEGIMVGRMWTTSLLCYGCLSNACYRRINCVIIRIGFPVWLRVLILDLLSEDNWGDRSDKVSRLASGINPGSVIGG